MSQVNDPHIVLVGLPGCGKSTAGRGLAEALGRPFLDFDSEIELREKAGIAEIVTQRGEPRFRLLELQLTRELSAATGMVLVPGGGWITNPEAVSLLRPPAMLIYLRVSPQTAHARLSREQGAVARRPLLSGEDPLATLRRLHARRMRLYLTADSALDADVLTRQEVTARLVQLASHRHKG